MVPTAPLERRVVADLLDRFRREGDDHSAALITPTAVLARGELLGRVGGAARAARHEVRLSVAPGEAAAWLPWLVGCALSGTLVQITQDGMAQAPEPHTSLPARAAAPGTPWLIVNSSGSTGASKALVRDRASWLRCFVAEEALLELHSSDRFLVVGGAGFTLVSYGVLRAIHLGAVVGVLPVPTPASTVTLLSRVDPSVIYGAPALLVALAKCAIRSGPWPGPRLAITGGARLSPGQRAVIEQSFPRARIVTFYGAAEVSYIAVRQPHDRLPPDCVGTLFPGVEVAADSAGRLHVRSPYAVQGRLGDEGEIHPVASADGWVALSDLGAVDAKGVIRLAGRSDGAIDTHGQFIAADAVERLLEAEPWVAEASVFSLLDEKHSQSVVAVLVPTHTPPAGAAQRLRDRCVGLPVAARPHQMLLVNSLPRTNGGKVDRIALAEALRSGNLVAEELP